MQAVEFEAEVKDMKIEIPLREKLDASHVKVILMWDIKHPAAETRKPERKLSPASLKTKNFKFDRQAANAR
ncbi:MAG: hypothetical protein JW808_10085 [Victivallales bacterium]|nr:hypothetical protein [Victivallales bacterium]